MVLAKTQIRSRLEAQNAQREKKIEQLNEFIARFSAGTRSSQVMSRKKEVERMQTADLARSNIQRPYMRFAVSYTHLDVYKRQSICCAVCRRANIARASTKS